MGQCLQQPSAEDFLPYEKKIIRIQAAYKGYSCRQRYKKMLNLFSIQRVADELIKLTEIQKLNKWEIEQKRKKLQTRFQKLKMRQQKIQEEEAAKRQKQEAKILKQKQEEERIKKQKEEEEERIRIEKQKEVQRQREQEERIKKEKEEEERIKREKKQEEDRIRRQQEEEERIKKEKEEEERIKREKKQEEDRIRRQQEEEERIKKEEEERIKREKKQEEDRIRRLQEEEERRKKEKEEEERIKREKKQEEDRIRRQQEEEERKKKEKEEEERIKREKKQEEDRIRRQQEEEERKKKVEEELRIKKQKEEAQRIYMQNQEQERLKKQKEAEDKIKELKMLNEQKLIAEQLKQKKVVEKIALLEKEVQNVSNNKTATKNFKTYYIAKYEQEKLQILKDSNQAKKPAQISHINQNITAENQEVLFYVISENLRRDQQRELIITPQSQKIGLTSALFSESEDQKCLKFRTTQANFEEINNNDEKKAEFILDFKKKIATNLKIPIDDIEILDIVQGSVQVLFTTKSKAELNKNELEVLEKVCGGKVEVYNYFAGVGKNSLVGLSSEDFAPKYNMQWAPTYNEKEERGPRYHRYNYYFPRGYNGYALNVLDKYGVDNRWILMDGNDEEWRILYHGTQHQFMQSIVQNGLAPGSRQAYISQICSFTNQPVGGGVYFSDQISVCEQGYTSPTVIGNKKFILVFQSRVNPKAVRQSQNMKACNYFVVNSSKDIRPYRILLKEV